MDLERALLSKIITTGQVEIALAHGLREDLFYDEECRDVFHWLVGHIRRYKTPPSISAVRDARPGFEFHQVEDPLPYLIDRFIGLSKRRLAQEQLAELARACDDPKRAEKIDLEFLEVGRKLATLVPAAQVGKFKEGMEARIQDQERVQKEGKATGIPFGFPWLDDKTGGIQPHEFITVVGFSGLGKSTFLIASAFNMFMADYTPLYISLEMERRVLLRKWDAMAASLDYRKLKQLKLDPADFERWRAKQGEIAKRAGEIPVIDSIRECTPDTIFAEAVRHKPDLVIVDYLSLMRSSRTSRNISMWQTLTEITQDLKQVARTLKTPILAAAQTNRAGAKDGAELDNVGYSLSVTQDPDIVIGLFADEQLRERKEMEIRLNKNRDGARGKFNAIWDHEAMLFRGKEMGDMFKRNRDEEPDADKAPKRSRPFVRRRPITGS